MTTSALLEVAVRRLRLLPVAGAPADPRKRLVLLTELGALGYRVENPEAYDDSLLERYPDLVRVPPEAFEPGRVTFKETHAWLMRRLWLAGDLDALAPYCETPTEPAAAVRRHHRRRSFAVGEGPLPAADAAAAAVRPGAAGGLRRAPRRPAPLPRPVARRRPRPAPGRGDPPLPPRRRGLRRPAQRADRHLRGALTMVGCAGERPAGRFLLVSNHSAPDFLSPFLGGVV